MRPTAYDKADNLISTTLADGSTVSYTYAKGGMPKAMTQQSDGESFVYHRTYNAAGMLKSAWQTGAELETSAPYQYAYNTAGLLSSLTDPKGQVTSYLYDTAGNLTTKTTADETLGYTYNRFGQFATVTRGNESIVTMGTYTFCQLFGQFNYVRRKSLCEKQSDFL